jgi:Domain of unknown function (DUF222)
MYVRIMVGTAVRDAVTALHDALADCDLNTLSLPELLALGDELQTLSCQLPTQSHRILARLQTEHSPRALGAKSWNEVLRTRWRISTAEAGRRLAEAAVLGPRRTLIGQPLAPVLPATAAAQAHGLINGEHVEVIRKAINRLPSFVDPATAAQFEIDLARLATGVGPKELTDAAARTLFLLDQDGPEPDEHERARQRGLSIGAQRRDGMIGIRGQLTPDAWATWEAIFAKYAAPGMCNPADDTPCTSGTPTQQQIDADHRTRDQRHHDALIAVGRIALMSGQLGQLNGLPVSIIIRTTLQDLQSRAGVGVSGGGTVLPIGDVIRLAGHAHHYLAVFDRATGSALNLFRARRVATPAQRIMLIARDGGCTKPCCTVGAYGAQVHHARQDWAHGGNTNVDDLTLACGVNNRMVGPDGWTTRLNDHHQVEWIPPPHLDTGQARINYYHQPEKLLHPPEHPEPLPDNTTDGPTPPDDPWADHNPGHPAKPGGPAPPLDDPWADDDTTEPTPPDNHAA